jgi:hypothetical protein
MITWRRSSRILLTIAIALTTFGADALLSQGRAPTNRRTVVLDGREVVEGEVIVRYRPQSGPIERERAEFQADSDRSEAVGRLGARRLRSQRLSTRQMLAALRANPDVELVEPNFIIRASAVPNDTSMDALWGLRNTGQNVDGQAGVPGADIGAVAAWDLTTGTRANVVAILDTGIDYRHPDLAANVFTAPRQFSVTLGEITVTCLAGTHGFNALNNSCTPFDDNGHGTHVAGIVGAVGDNAAGVTGVNWTANLMGLKVLDATGTGTTTDAIKAIDFAIKAKAALGADANVRAAATFRRRWQTRFRPPTPPTCSLLPQRAASAATTIRRRIIRRHWRAATSSASRRWITPARWRRFRTMARLRSISARQAARRCRRFRAISTDT